MHETGETKQVSIKRRQTELLAELMMRLWIPREAQSIECSHFKAEGLS